MVRVRWCGAECSINAAPARFAIRTGGPFRKTAGCRRAAKISADGIQPRSNHSRQQAGTSGTSANGDIDANVPRRRHSSGSAAPTLRQRTPSLFEPALRRPQCAAFTTMAGVAEECARLRTPPFDGFAIPHSYEKAVGASRVLIDAADARRQGPAHGSWHDEVRTVWSQDSVSRRVTHPIARPVTQNPNVIRRRGKLWILGSRSKTHGSI